MITNLFLKPVLRFTALFILTGCFLSLSGQSVKFDNTAGEVNFTFQTVTDNGDFAPKHVLAVWIEDSQGFVKTRKLRANERKQYLYTWRSVSNDNVVDAVTGATLSSHQTHDINWDCTDIEGNVVPDGEYTLHVEFTEGHAQGPLLSVPFTKGTEELHLTPADEEHFINITLDYIPEITGINDLFDMELTIFPNPGNGHFTINYFTENNFILNVYNASGRLLIHKEINASTDDINIDLTSYHSGMYFVEIEQTDTKRMVKIIKQ